MMYVVFFIVALLLVGGGVQVYAADKTAVGDPKNQPAKVESSQQAGISRLTLSAQAAERLGIKTDSVATRAINGKDTKIIPYAAVLYDVDGDTWAYTNPEQLVYIRQKITVDKIEGDTAMLIDGPALGTSIVTIGVAELLGIELGIGK